MSERTPGRSSHVGPGRPPRRWSWLGALAAVLLLAGIAALAAVAILAEDEEPADRPPGEVVVELETLRTETLRQTVSAVGTLRASAAVELRPELAGRVQAIHFEEGAAVSEGELLVQIDDEKLRRQLAARQAAQRVAQVRLDNARRTFARQEALRERGVVSADEFDRAQAELDSAEAELERLAADLALVERQIEDAQIRAPFDGWISQRLVDRGAYVNVGDPLARLYQTDPLVANFSLPERYIGQVQHGQPVHVTVRAFPGRVFEGRVQFISPAIDESTRDFLVKAALANPDGELKPGGFATAQVVLAEREAVVAPEQALVATRQGFRLFVVNDEGQAVMRDVRVGLRHNGTVELLEGGEAGERVVRAGHMRLAGGETVREAGANEAEGADGR